LALLVRWNICRHEQNLAQLAAFARCPRQRQVSAMDRIKSSAKQSNIHERLVSRFPGSIGKPNFSWSARRMLAVTDRFSDIHRQEIVHCLLGPAITSKEPPS